MTNAILSAEHRALLAGIALSNVLIAFDFEGTLAPVAPTPAEARMRPCTQRLLSAIAARYPCVVISGHALDDVAGHLSGVPVWHLFGNHGLERGAAGDTGKGVALREALRCFACHSAIYIGDDASDEDAFAAAGPDRILGIRVGATSGSAARYHVETQADVDALLELLIELRATRDWRA